MRKTSASTDSREDPSSENLDDRHEIRRANKAREAGTRPLVAAVLKQQLGAGATGTAAELARMIRPALIDATPLGLVTSVLRELERERVAEFVKRRGSKSFWRATPSPTTGDELLHGRVSPRRAEYLGMRQEYQRDARQAVIARDRVCIVCGADRNLQAAHVVPVRDLIELVESRAAHQPILMVALCSDHHTVFDGGWIETHEERKRALHEQRERVDQKEDELVRQRRDEIRGRSWRAEDRRRDRISRHLSALNAEHARLREEVRSAVLESVRTRLRLDQSTDVEEELCRQAVLAFAELNDLVATERGFETSWKSAGWRWNRELSVWHAPPGTATPDVPATSFRVLGKTTADVEARYRENAEFRSRRLALDRLDALLVLLARMEDGPVPVARLASGRRCWSHAKLVGLGLCVSTVYGTQRRFELTPLGRLVLSDFRDVPATHTARTAVVRWRSSTDQRFVAELVREVVARTEPQGYVDGERRVAVLVDAVRSGRRSLVLRLPGCEFDVIDGGLQAELLGG